MDEPAAKQAGQSVDKARGDGNAIAQESIKLIEAQAKAQAAEAQAAEKAAAALTIKRDEMIAQAGGYSELNDAQKAQVDTLSQEIAAILSGVDASAKKRIAQQLEIANSDAAINAAKRPLPAHMGEPRSVIPSSLQARVTPCAHGRTTPPPVASLGSLPAHMGEPLPAIPLKTTAFAWA